MRLFNFLNWLEVPRKCTLKTDINTTLDMCIFGTIIAILLYIPPHFHLHLTRHQDIMRFFVYAPVLALASVAAAAPVVQDSQSGGDSSTPEIDAIQKRSGAGIALDLGVEFIKKFVEQNGNIKHPGWNPTKNPGYGSGGSYRRRT
ncbi:hypothetical protein GGI12_001772 [Dipsacomyces acuminosporus]|nr:hypothetical protein GGI12_001772 [Dipsacomyces acuminosporus]